MSSQAEMPGQLSLHCGALSLTLSSQGGACTSLRWHADASGVVDLLQPRSKESQEHFEQPSFPLVPYSNRLFAGQLLTPEGALTLPCNHARHPIPVHGLGWRANWSTRQLNDHSAEQQHQHEADVHWPFAYDCTQHVSLSEDAAHFELSLRNLSDRPMPAGLGFHPWFAIDEDSTVCFAAEAVWMKDGQGLPATALPAGSAPEFEFSSPRLAMDIVQDHCHAGWRGPVCLTHPRRQIALSVTASAELEHLMVYRRPGQPWLCLEPVSHATGALSLPALNTPASGARLLAPGERWSVWMNLRVMPLQTSS
jgi:aldose 1-epimerase